MEILSLRKRKSADSLHQPEVSQQTGFPSAATHYAEPSIDLHRELVARPNATFFVRISGNAFQEFNILENDVLVVDRSLPAKNNSLALVVENGEFQISRISKKLEKETFLWGIITYIIHKTL